MNHWVVIFNDAPEMVEMRKQYFQDHIAYLTAQRGIFVDGASLAESEDASPEGGIWIVCAKDRESIVRLIEGDPIYRRDLREYRIYATGKQFRLQVVT